MSTINKKTSSDYSDFEYQWVILILCRELLTRKDMLCLLKHFNMRFFGDDWENKISLEEMGRVIVSDVERDDLFPYLSDYLKKHYPKLFSYEEAKKIHDALFNIDDEVEIMKVWLSMSWGTRFAFVIEEQLNNYEKLKKEGKLNKSISLEEKMHSGSIYWDMSKEIVLSLYKLAMKSYLN